MMYNRLEHQHHPPDPERFIQKPFSKEDLAKTVRKALDDVTGSV
jgi:hypothetical protein